MNNEAKRLFPVWTKLICGKSFSGASAAFNQVVIKKNPHKFSVNVETLLDLDSNVCHESFPSMPYENIWIEMGGFSAVHIYVFDDRSGVFVTAFSTDANSRKICLGNVFAIHDARKETGESFINIRLKEFSNAPYDNGRDPVEITESFAKVIVLTLELLNCKNVVYENLEEVELNRDLKRQLRRKSDGSFKYHVLKLDLSTKKRQNIVNLNDPSFKMPLHSRRGHFKTYTADAPLFGQHVGTWYWNPDLVGDPEVGVVDKDYAL